MTGNIAQFVESASDPLWQEWLAVERRVWMDGIHTETTSIQLGKVRRGALRRIIDEFQDMVDMRVPRGDNPE